MEDLIKRSDAIKAFDGEIILEGKENKDAFEKYMRESFDRLKVIPSAVRPSGEDCEFCRCHEKEDVLYELIDWDCGLAFDEIRNIKYCPLCGAMLKGADDEV